MCTNNNLKLLKLQFLVACKKIASLYNDIGFLKSFLNGDTIMHNITNETIPFEKMGRTLVWHDEFDGEELNADKWRIHQTMNGADRIYTSDKEHIFVKDGCLNLVTDRSGEKEKPFVVPEGVLTQKQCCLNTVFGKCALNYHRRLCLLVCGQTVQVLTDFAVVTVI